ncbi:response regulator [Sedimenticola thiotaurini]|uniref:Transcriptional regulator NarL n=1 Tax=Sedimenticola thiotaurini TaxID=1543721 RepID=A0A0F7K1S6_9GAMM|nr:response regulator [Sedimenticola thiotaurini]AKH21827.1 transcriptional regulator NarL [Sedimenticola thiotaurini]
MRILLIDDHALFRIGLQELLQRRGINVIGAFGDCQEGIELASREQPDVVLLDMRMPDMSGIEVLQVLREKGLTMPIAMLTTSREESDVINALQGGAQGYLLKDMEPDELINALRAIVGGATIVAQELTGILAKAVQGESETTAARDVFSDLTPREAEILCLLADGQSNKVIARNLGISDGTVKLHVKSILRKLNVHSRVEAAVIAVEQALCSREQ